MTAKIHWRCLKSCSIVGTLRFILTFVRVIPLTHTHWLWPIYYSNPCIWEILFIHKAVFALWPNWVKHAQVISPKQGKIQRKKKPKRNRDSRKVHLNLVMVKIWGPLLRVRNMKWLTALVVITTALTLIHLQMNIVPLGFPCFIVVGL